MAPSDLFHLLSFQPRLRRTRSGSLGGPGLLIGGQAEVGTREASGPGVGHGLQEGAAQGALLLECGADGSQFFVAARLAQGMLPASAMRVICSPSS